MITKFETYKMNEGFSWMLTIASAFFLYKFIKGFLKHRKFSKMSNDEIEEYEKEEKYKKQYKLLTYYVKQYINDGNKIEFSENYIYYIFELGTLTIKIDKQNKTIFWNYIIGDINHIGKWKTSKRIEFDDIDMEQEYEYIEPIPISQEEIDGLVKALKEDQENDN